MDFHERHMALGHFRFRTFVRQRRSQQFVEEFFKSFVLSRRDPASILGLTNIYNPPPRKRTSVVQVFESISNHQGHKDQMNLNLHPLNQIVPVTDPRENLLHRHRLCPHGPGCQIFHRRTINQKDLFSLRVND